VIGIAYLQSPYTVIGLWFSGNVLHGSIAGASRLQILNLPSDILLAIGRVLQCSHRAALNDCHDVASGQC
jgi:hypothetical protein